MEHVKQKLQEIDEDSRSAIRPSVHKGRHGQCGRESD